MAACPSCGVTLDRAPKRRASCPQCGRPIAVRKGRLCTDEEARAIDACAGLGIPLEALFAARERLPGEGGGHASAADAAWRLLDELAAKAPDHHARGMVYLHMALFLWREGRDHLPLALQARQMQLAEWKLRADEGLLDLRRVRIAIMTTRKASCPACRALEQAEFTWDEAMAANPIPVPACTNAAGAGRIRGWCRCNYVLHL